MAIRSTGRSAGRSAGVARRCIPPWWGSGVRWPRVGGIGVCLGVAQVVGEDEDAIGHDVGGYRPIAAVDDEMRRWVGNPVEHHDQQI